MNTVEDVRQAEVAPAPQASLLTARFGRRRSIFLLPIFALVLGLTLTGVLTALSREVYVRNQHRLLRLRLRDAAGLVTSALPALQTPLASAAELADATNGNRAKFRLFASPYVGLGRQFISLSLWNLHDPAHGPVAVVGLRPKLASSPSQVPAFFARVGQASTLSVIGLLTGADARLGYAYSTPGATGGYVAYAEAALPKNRRSRLGASTPFTGLNYALWLNDTRPQNLLATNVQYLPLPGTSARMRVPFGDGKFVIEFSTEHSLAGSLPEELPWIIAIGGVVLSLAAASGALRLTQRRLAAEQLAKELEVVARENRELYAEQRTIAQTLQHALLPERLPELSGVRTAGRYEAGERTVDIGGDWYDVIELADRCLLLVIGDVSGRGLRAATTMASLRFAIHAYAAQGDSPQEILGKLSRLISVSREGQLATILCARVDVDSRTVEITSAGHLPVLLLAPGEARYVRAPVGVPVGVDPEVGYRTETLTVPEGTTILAFTDGLVEKRGEHLDQGLERLRRAATGKELALPELLSNLVGELSMDGASDDIAIVGLQWTT